MRKFALMFVLLAVLLPVDLFGQNHITSVSVGSGQDPISSGMSMALRFENLNGKLFGEFAAQHEQAWLAVGRQVHGRISGFVAVDVGHFQGAAWGGPYISLATPIMKVGGKELTLSTLQWPGVYFSKPSSKSEANLQGLDWVAYLSSFSVSWGPVSLNHAMLHFMDDPWNALPGVSVSLPLTKDVVSTSTYTRNTNAKSAMYFMGVSWTPSNK